MSINDLTSAQNSLNKAQTKLNNNSLLNTEYQNKYKSDGFTAPTMPAADGNGLPYSKVPDNKPGQIRRNIITWFVPEFGIVKMYVNPNSITYYNKKLITKERTKGGFSLQYWGEDLTQLTIQGTTGSSGIEGINALYEVYRAEQYAFDAVGLSLSASNIAADAVSKATNSLGDSLFAGGGSLLSGVLGIDSPNNSFAIKNVMSLAQLAFSVEMYYNGWVYRGFFDSMNITERSDSFLFDYNITYYSTQRRGYRVNQFPFQRSPKAPSEYSTPTSFNQNNITNPNANESIIKTYNQ